MITVELKICAVKFWTESPGTKEWDKKNSVTIINLHWHEWLKLYALTVSLRLSAESNWASINALRLKNEVITMMIIIINFQGDCN